MTNLYRGFISFRIIPIVVVALLGLACLATSASAAEPPVPGAIPANEHKETVTTTTSEVHATLQMQIRHYERTRNVLVAVHMRKDGVKSTKGCVDPVRKGWIKVGQRYINTRKNGSPFTDVWQAGRKICKAKRVKKGKRWFMVGTKDNCGNKGIRIQIKGPKKFKKYRKVVEVKSVAEFRAIYREFTRSTTTTKVTYTCPAGYTLVGTWCYPPPAKDGTQAPQPPAEAPGPNPTPDPADPYPGGYQCYNETTGAPVEPRADGTCPPGSYGGPAV